MPALSAEQHLVPTAANGWSEPNFLVGENAAIASIANRDAIASDVILAGSIQVSGKGHPVILLADRQTTSGYPKIATVISADVPRLGRVLPSKTMRFEAVSAGQVESFRCLAETVFSK